MGMLVQLKELLLFDNSLVTLPNELGTLYQLETLGLEGNPIHADLKSLLLKEGSQAVIVSLRENCPGMNFIYSCIVLDCHLVCHAGYLT
jgi:CCR4-NOT transcription complex subunit 6